MSTELSAVARDTWRAAVDHQAALHEAQRLMVEYDRILTRVVENYREMPAIRDMHAQASVVSDVVDAAQAYRRDLLKLLALAGGYDKEDA